MENLFDKAFAYTWKGKNVRLGSINYFPILPGMYQWPTWGVGWQTMPVSFMVYNEQVSFLRFCVREGKNFRSHPSQDFHSAYLNPALFKEDCLPDPETISTQRDNILIVQRNIKNVANSAAEVLDEWKIPRFKGKIHRLPSNLYTQITSTVSVTHSVPEEIWIKNVTKWTVLENKHFAILALSYIDYGSETAKTSDLEINEGENELRLTRVFYRGEEKYLRQHRFDNAWVILAFGSKISLEELNEQLQHCEIKDLRYTDYEVPRNDLFMVREISVKCHDGRTLIHKHDPYS